MKRRILILSVLVIILAGLSCKEYDFENPVDPGQAIVAPTDLQITSASEISITLQWAIKSLPTNYENAQIITMIERSTDGINFGLVDSVGGNVTTKSLCGVYLLTTTYSFRVRAKCANNYSGYSNIATAVAQLSGPSNLNVTSITSTSANLQWTDNSSIETRYLIERSNDGVDFLLVDSVDANFTSRSVAGVYVICTTYSFRVRAMSVHDYSGFSNAATGRWQADVSMVSVSGGTFQMGSNSGNNDERPVHSVTLGAFYVDKTEITYEKWTDVRNWGLMHGYTDLPAGRNGFTGTTNHPVTEVSWYDILKWCNARSEKDGLTPVYYTISTFSTVYHTGQLDLASDAVNWTTNGYRLPTEAEWEFAARGGTKSEGYTYSGSNNLDDVAWYYVNWGNNTHPVGTKRANELGLYDMTGNVWEWCWDWYGSFGAPAQTDPKGPTSGIYRVLRGGSILDYLAFVCRVALRNGQNPPGSSGLNEGFRCVQK